jgi:hypothetical protein
MEAIPPQTLYGTDEWIRWKVARPWNGVNGFQEMLPSRVFSMKNSTNVR